MYYLGPALQKGQETTGECPNFTKAKPLNLLAKVCKGVMSKAKYLWSGSQYTQDNWPMNQSDCYLQSSSLLKNFCIIFTRPSSLLTVGLTEGLGTRLCDTSSLLLLV